jgi:multiple sugar transport system substrate-binding protein
MSRRFMLAVGLVVVMLAANTAVALPAAPHAKTTNISFMTFDAVPAHIGDLNKIIKGFEKSHPTIHVNVIPVAYASYFTKLATLVAGGQTPDTFELDYQDFVQYAAKGTLMPLSKVAPKAKYASVFYPRALGAFALHKKQYGLPETFSDVLLFYNQDLFKKAHVAYPSLGWKWANELSAAKKLTKGHVYGLYEPVQFFEFYKVLHQAGGQFFDKHGKVAFDNSKGLTTVNWLVNKINKYHVTPTAAQMGGLSDGDMFCSGKLAMDITGIWMFPTFAACHGLHWDVQVEPGNVAKGTHYFANAIAISAHSKAGKAAYQWMNYYTTSALSASVRIKSSWELPAVQKKSLVSAYLKQRPPAHRSVVFQALKWPVLPPVITDESQMQSVVSNDLAKVEDGSMSPKAALNDMKTQINKLH